VAGYRIGENPARWKGHLAVMLAAPSKIQETKHFPAISYYDVGAFMQRLKQVEGQGAVALRFTILTAARSGQTRGANWSEIDFDEAMWVIPKARMKAKREHRVPLSESALQILKAQPRIAGTDLIFPASNGKALSDATMSAVLKRMKVEAVPHGFRSTFKDWCSELTNYPPEVSEMALAHAVGDKVEEAYRRGDLLTKRVQAMEDWADFCSKAYVARPKVVAIKAA
jgi:integrase